MYCPGDDKHGAQSKYQELIERATYGDQGWHHIRDYLLKMNDKKYKNLNSSAPFSIRKASELLKEHFQEFLKMQKGSNPPRMYEDVQVEVETPVT